MWIQFSSLSMWPVHLGPGASGGRRREEEWRGKRKCRGERTKNMTWGDGRRRGRWMRVVGWGWCWWGEGGILQSCCLDILCFDGLAFIFMAVFLCCGGAVLKSSIFSWYYRSRQIVINSNAPSWASCLWTSVGTSRHDKSNVIIMYHPNLPTTQDLAGFYKVSVTFVQRSWWREYVCACMHLCRRIHRAVHLHF